MKKIDQQSLYQIQAGTFTASQRQAHPGSSHAGPREDFLSGFFMALGAFAFEALKIWWSKDKNKSSDENEKDAFSKPIGMSGGFSF